MHSERSEAVTASSAGGKRVIYGDGRVKTNIGTVENWRCLTMKIRDESLPIGATSLEKDGPEAQENFDVIIAFKNIESARVLQDMLNELVCEWARDISPKVDVI